MEEEVPFEAEHVLQELYNLDAVVQGVQAGTWETYIRFHLYPPLLCCIRGIAALIHNHSCHSPLLCSYCCRFCCYCCCCFGCCCCKGVYAAVLIPLLLLLLLLLLLWLLLLTRCLCGCADAAATASAAASLAAAARKVSVRLC